MEEGTANLAAVLAEAQGLGFLGPGPVETHLSHSAALAALLGPFDGAFVDLGSGAGVPGLLLLRAWPNARALLVEAQERRATFLEQAARRLGLDGRAAVARGRAEDLAREPSHRARYGLVVARSFGRPAVTAECAVGFLAPGGLLAVSEPPGGGHWDHAGLSRLGLEGPAVRRSAAAGVAVLVRSGPLDDRWPRRSGMPAKRPLWR